MLNLIHQTFTNRENRRLLVSTILGLAGASASFATLYAAPMPKAHTLSCGVQALSCSAALTSPVAKIAGVPLGIIGAIYFLFWTLNLRAYHRTRGEAFQTSLTWATAVGAVVSLVLATYMFLILRRPCLYCLITHVSNLASCVLLWPFRRWKPAVTDASEFWHFASISTVAILAGTTAFFANQARQAASQLSLARQGAQTEFHPTAPTRIYSHIRELPEALAEAKRSSKSVFLLVYHPMCGGCRIFKKNIYASPEFTRFAEDNLVQWVINAQESDLTEFESLPVRLSKPIVPTVFPTAALIAPDGNVKWLDEGLEAHTESTPEHFVAHLREQIART